MVILPSESVPGFICLAHPTLSLYHSYTLFLVSLPSFYSSSSICFSFSCLSLCRSLPHFTPEIQLIDKTALCNLCCLGADIQSHTRFTGCFSCCAVTQGAEINTSPASLSSLHWLYSWLVPDTAIFCSDLDAGRLSGEEVSSAASAAVIFVGNALERAKWRWGQNRSVGVTAEREEWKKRIKWRRKYRNVTHQKKGDKIRIKTGIFG